VLLRIRHVETCKVVVVENSLNSVCHVLVIELKSAHPNHALRFAIKLTLQMELVSSHERLLLP